jgi:two-component system phosphate regulon response regulator PhoB
MNLEPVSSTKVMLVEDDADICSSIRDILESEGYEVASAGDGEEAMRLLRDMIRKPQLILLDLKLPGKDGLQFRREQREDGALSAIPVVFLSADGKLKEKTADAGIRGLLRKPVDLEELLSAVRTHAV